HDETDSASAYRRHLPPHARRRHFKAKSDRAEIDSIARRGLDLVQGRAMQAKRLMVFLGQTDHWHHAPLYLAILETLRAAGCAGATVTVGIAGFGPHGHIKTRGFVDVSIDLPVIVTVIDRADRIEGVLPQITAMLAGGVVTVEDVEV